MHISQRERVNQMNKSGRLRPGVFRHCLLAIHACMETPYNIQQKLSFLPNGMEPATPGE